MFGCFMGVILPNQSDVITVELAHRHPLTHNGLTIFAKQRAQISTEQFKPQLYCVILWNFYAQIKHFTAFNRVQASVTVFI